jgi:two-component system sensor histidine kinase KdpD
VVRETVPDTFLQRAHSLELVDLAPEDLIKRLREGKVYQGEIAGRAADNFFKPGNLIALRELALRHAAEHVDAQMQAFRERNAIEDVWSVGERLLVGVSASPMSARMIRAASRLATRLRAPWIAVHVETPATLGQPAEERAQVINNVRLAEELGAETVTLTGENVTAEVLAYARSHNVTRIVLGKPAFPKWKELFRGSVVNDMARRCGNIDLHIISGSETDPAGRRSPVQTPPANWAAVRWGALVVGLCTLACWPLANILDRVNLVMVYLVGVVWCAYRYGRRASLVAAILSVLAFDFFFVPPYLTFAVGDAQYFITFGIMLGVGLLIGTITGRLRVQTSAMRKREQRMRALYKLSRDLSETPDTRQMLKTAANQLGGFYRIPVLILTGGPHGDLAIGAGDPQLFGWNENEHSVARWVFDKSQAAGAGSDTLGGAKGLYLPLKGIRSTVGVLAVRPDDAKAFTDPEQIQLLETFASEIGGALESTRMSEAIGRSEMQMDLQAIRHPKSDARLRIGDFLAEERIAILPVDAATDEIFRDLLARLALPNPSQAMQAILEREKSGPTLIAQGVAAPHARIPGLEGVRVALGVNKGGPVHIWLLFVSPASDPRVHLAFLASVSAFFQDSRHAIELREMNSAREVLDYVRRTELAILPLTPQPRG